MLTNGQAEETPLSNSEECRIDGLFGAARRFHYMAFVCAGLSILIALIGTEGKFTLPLGGMELPTTKTTVALYLLAIVLIVAADRFAIYGLYWSAFDSRRPPFPWVALGLQRNNHLLVSLWLSLPLLACSIGTAISLKHDLTGVALSFPAIFTAFMPRVITRYMHHILGRTDARGGVATFSIYLLYWFRLFRQIFLAGALFVPVLAAITPWRDVLTPLTAYLCGIAIVIHLVMSVGKFVYRTIDRIGTKFGFPSESVHYR